jgi:predicted small lipoprotein YifL
MALLAAIASLTACGIRIPPIDQNPDPDSDKGTPVTGTDLSTLDADGIARILDSKTARFDMSDGTIDKSVLGLPADEYAPDVQSRDGLISLEIVGPQGSVTASTDRIRFFTTDAQPDVDRITYFLVAESTDEFFELLRDGSDAYGLDRASVDDWIDAVATDSDGVSDFSFDPGTTVGLNVNYDVRYDESAAVQVAIVDVYPL